MRSVIAFFYPHLMKWTLWRPNLKNKICQNIPSLTFTYFSPSSIRLCSPISVLTSDRHTWTSSFLPSPQPLQTANPGPWVEQLSGKGPAEPLARARDDGQRSLQQGQLLFYMGESPSASCSPSCWSYTLCLLTASSLISVVHCDLPGPAPICGCTHVHCSLPQSQSHATSPSNFLEKIFWLLEFCEEVFLYSGRWDEW